MRFSADRRDATQPREWLDTGAGAFLDVTARDNVLLSAAPVNGAVVSGHVGAIPFADSGYPMETYRRDGTLVVAGEVAAIGHGGIAWRQA